MEREGKGEHIYMSSATRTLLYRLVEYTGLNKSAVVRNALELLGRAYKNEKEGE